MIELVDKNKTVRKGNNKYNRNPVDHKNTICYLCKKKDTYINKRKRISWIKYRINDNEEFDRKKEWDGETYICHYCYNKIREKFPVSRNNFRKSQTKCRNKQLKKDSSLGKGYIGEQIFCKVRGIDNCNIKMDNFHYRYDQIDPEYGTVDTKFAVENKRGYWNISPRGNCDTIVCICMNKDWTNIDFVFIIPKKDIHVKHLSISRNSDSWYISYRINERPYNEAYHSMSLKDCHVLKDNFA